jgi:uncharacterized protein (TIGR00369 family)
MSASEWAEVMRRVLERSAGVGIVPVETVRAQTGLEFLRDVAEGRHPRAPISDTLGFQLVEVERGRAVFQGMPAAAHANPMGTVHGGWSATLLDSAMSCAVHSTLAAGQGYTTAEFKVSLVRPVLAGSGPLRAEGKVIHVGRTVATSEGRLYDADGKLYAHGTETCVVFAI